MEDIKREFKGIWIPKEVLEKGLPTICAWVQSAYKVDLYSENPLEEPINE